MFGDVYLVADANSNLYALKVVDKQKIA
jgi:hypothetical protein